MRWPTRSSRPVSGQSGTDSSPDRDAAVAAATALFRSRGFGAVSFADVAEESGTSATQVQDWFGEETQLFEEAYVRELAAMSERLGGYFTSADPVQMMRSALEGWLEEMRDPGVRRVIVLDAPEALGWQRWRDAGDPYGRMLIEAGLADAMAKGALPEQPVRPLGHVISGALEAGVQYAAHQPDPDAALGEVRAALVRMLEGVFSR